MDVSLGIPPEEVVKILENFRKELFRENISLIIVEDFSYWNDPSTDGTHLTEEGYEAWSKILNTWMKKEGI